MCRIISFPGAKIVLKLYYISPFVSPFFGQKMTGELRQARRTPADKRFRASLAMTVKRRIIREGLGLRNRCFRGGGGALRISGVGRTRRDGFEEGGVVAGVHAEFQI
jgi:hypothetical protein